MSEGFGKNEIVAYLRSRKKSAPWRTAKTVAKALGHPDKVGVATSLLAELWKTGGAKTEIRPSYYPSKRTLAVLWAHTHVVGGPKRETELVKMRYRGKPVHNLRKEEVQEPGTPLFLSHSHADEKTALDMQNDLAARGYDLWLAEVEIEFGGQIAESIVGAMRTSQAVLVLLTSNSIGSRWVGKEFEQARVRVGNQRVIPVVDTRDRKLLTLLGDSDLSQAGLSGIMPSDVSFRQSWHRNADILLRSLYAQYQGCQFCGYPASGCDGRDNEHLPLRPLNDRLDEIFGPRCGTE